MLLLWEFVQHNNCAVTAVQRSQKQLDETPPDDAIHKTSLQIGGWPTTNKHRRSVKAFNSESGAEQQRSSRLVGSKQRVESLQSLKKWGLFEKKWAVNKGSFHFWVKKKTVDGAPNKATVSRRHGGSPLQTTIITTGGVAS